MSRSLAAGGLSIMGESADQTTRTEPRPRGPGPLGPVAPRRTHARGTVLRFSRVDDKRTDRRCKRSDIVYGVAGSLVGASAAVLLACSPKEALPPPRSAS